MTQPSLPNSLLQKGVSPKRPQERTRSKAIRPRRSAKSSDVLVSAVISSYLLTHLHHVLQRAEYGAMKEGHSSQAKNFAQLRKVLCMDARSMKDASASGLREGELENVSNSKFNSKAA